MAFGQAQQQQGSTQGGAGERWELRDLQIVQGDEKTTGKGKVYWRVKDSQNHWYSVWEAAVKIRLEIAAEKSETVTCAVQIKPGNNGGAPFYTIAATDDAAKHAVEQGNVKAVANVAPGGRNSEFGRRMHPDDALRVTNLASMERALHMVSLTIMDKPENVNYETYVKAKVMEYMNFLNSLLKQPLTHQEPPVDEEPPPPRDDYETYA